MKQLAPAGRRWGRALIMLPVLAAAFLNVATVSATGEKQAVPPGPDTDIASSGPLTHIQISPDLNCQVNHTGDLSPEFFGGNPGACGTLVTAGTTLFTPAQIPAGGGATGAGVPWTMVSQTGVLGTGTSSDPFRVVTVVRGGATGLTVTETDSYVQGQESYRTDVMLSNTGLAPLSGLLYRAGDCFLQNSDFGFGRADAATGAIACTASQAANSRIEQWFPLTPGSSYMESFYATVWSRIGSKMPFANTCDCGTFEDNGAGLSWAYTLAPGGSTTFSHLTTFSPLGFAPLSTAKTADSATATAGGPDGYTITISNSNIASVTVNSITDTLPAGFSYTAGSTTGVTTSNPAISGSTLTWSGSFNVPAGGSISLHFGVTVSTVPGTYTNNAGGDAGTVAVAPTGPTAPITVNAAPPPPQSGGFEASAPLEPFNSQVEGWLDFHDSGTSLMVNGTATGMDPGTVYVLYISDNTTSACNGGSSSLTPAQSLVGTWVVDGSGNGTLTANKTGPSYVPLGSFHTVNTNVGSTPVACGDVGPAHP